jgi:hypothetical protein
VKWNTTAVSSNSSGVYTLSNVTSGTQTITASATGYLPVTSTVNVSGGTSTLNFQLSTAGILNVTVVNSSGAGVSGAPVSISGGIIATTLNGTTNSSGVWSSNWIPVGNYTISSGTVSATATVNTGQTTNATLTQGSAPPALATITGTVTNISNGMTLSGATVQWNTTSVTANSSGVYSMNNVTTGTQTLTASATGYLPRSLTVNAPSGGTATLNFPLATAGKITVKAVNSAGAADAGVTVSISGGVIATTINGTTNSSGIFTTNWTAVGSYTITISQTGHTTQSKSATVTAGATTTVNFTF